MNELRLDYRDKCMYSLQASFSFAYYFQKITDSKHKQLLKFSEDHHPRVLLMQHRLGFSWSDLELVLSGANQRSGGAVGDHQRQCGGVGLEHHLEQRGAAR